MSYAKMQETGQLADRAAHAEFEGKFNEAQEIEQLVDPQFATLFAGMKQTRLAILLELSYNPEIIVDEY